MVTCDNSKNTEATDCSYTYKLGSTFSTKLSQSLSISETFSADVGVTLEGFFSANAGFSTTTGFEFTASYDFTHSLTQTITVDTKVEGGEGLV